jgi:hypothetical protein
MKDVERQHHVIISGVFSVLVEPADVVLHEIVELPLFGRVLDLDGLRSIPVWKDLLSTEIDNLLFEPPIIFGSR